MFQKKEEIPLKVEATNIHNYNIALEKKVAGLQKKYDVAPELKDSGVEVKFYKGKNCKAGGIRGLGPTVDDAIAAAESQTGVELTDPEVASTYKMHIAGNLTYLVPSQKVKKEKKKSKGTPAGKSVGYDTISDYF